jgi:endonuclease YncB( thermonuclease family)
VGSDHLRALALAAVLLCAACGGAPTSPQAGTATVDSVRDGDTILLEDGRRVRLVQVDAPELGAECWGDASFEALERLAPEGSELRLERDPLLDDVDRHGRLLRYAHAGTRNLNLEAVRAGAAAPYFYRGVRGRYARELEAAARVAQTERRGLWGACPRARLRPERQLETGLP